MTTRRGAMDYGFRSRDYRYSKLAAFFAVLLGCLGVAFLGGTLLGFVIAVRCSSEWLPVSPSWLKTAFWLLLLAGAAAGLGVTYVLARFAIALLQHRDDLIVLQEEAVVVVRRDTRAAFPWEQLALRSDHLLGFRIRAGPQECWVLPGLRGYNDLRGRIEAGIMSFRAAPELFPENRQLKLYPDGLTFSLALAGVIGAITVLGLVTALFAMDLRSGSGWRRAETVCGVFLGFILEVLSVVALRQLLGSHRNAAVRASRSGLEYWDWHGVVHALSWDQISALDVCKGKYVAVWYTGEGGHRVLRVRNAIGWDRRLVTSLVDLIVARAGLRFAGQRVRLASGRITTFLRHSGSLG